MSYYIDGHCDSATRPGVTKLLTGSAGQLDLPRLQANYKAQFFAFFLNSLKYGDHLLKEMLTKVALFKQTLDECAYADYLLKASDLNKNQVLALLSLEGVEVLEGRVELADIWFQLGFRAMGLTWNYDNWAAGACGGNNTGLTEPGYDLVNKLNELGIIIDLAHSSRKTFADVLACSKKPVIVSHACCYSLCKHRRNLTDQELRLLAAKGGVCGITFYPEFLTNGAATIEDVIEHIHYAVNIAGLEQVALGSDFDGMDSLPVGLNGAQDMAKLEALLSQRGYTAKAAEKLMGGNWYRFLTENLP